MISPEALIAKGPTEKLSEQTPSPPSTVPSLEIKQADVEPLSATIPADIAEKKFDADAFKKLKSADDDEVIEPIKKDDATEKALKEEEAKAKAREEAEKKAKEQEVSVTKREDKPKDEKPKDESIPQPIVSKKQAPTERDYSGLTEAEVEVLKKSSNEAFELAKSRIIELKEVKEAHKQLEAKLTKIDKSELPDSYFEHPKAYILDEKWNQAMANVNVLSQEINHWERQLEAVEKGEEWVELQKRNEDGTYQIVRRPANVEAKTAIMRRIQHGDALIRQHAQIASEIENTTQQRGANLRKGIVERENYLFPEYTDSKKFYESNKAGQSMFNYLKSGGLDNNMLAGAFCKMYAKLMEYESQISELEKKTTVAKVEEKVKEAGGPSSGEINKGVESKKEEIKSLEDMPFNASAFDKLTKDE